MLSIGPWVRVVKRPPLGVADVVFQNPNKNKLLAALPEADFQRISGQLELRQMVVGEVL